LMERDLVRTAGRAAELGRPYWYATTKRFLQVFGLRHLDDLPRYELLRASASQPVEPIDHALPHDTFSGTAGIQDNLTQTTASEDEEEFDRDHHRPA